ncbi:MAG: multicopper oxidase family protein [Leptothrix sp. (in: b-proteobacteria)]
MSTRRHFLKQSASGLAWSSGTSLVSTALATGRAAAATVGNPDRGTWAAHSDDTILAAAWAARFTSPLTNLLEPATTLRKGYFYAPDASGSSHYTISAAQTRWNVLGIVGANNAPLLTTVWGYGRTNPKTLAVDVTFPGRTFQVNRGQPINVSWRNQLVDANGATLPHLLGIDQSIAMQSDPVGRPIDGVPISIHHHGGDTAAEFDGGPDQWITPKRVQIGPGVSVGKGGAAGVNANALDDALSYTYDNTEEASLTWYHDHAEGLTRLNAYAGLAGVYVTRDSNEAELIRRNILPTGAYESVLMLQDKMFDANGQFIYPGDPLDYPPDAFANPLPDTPTHLPEMFGDVICVNGNAWPVMQVEPRAYRLRLINAADSRFFTLTFNGADGVAAATPFRLIGNDLGLGNTAPSLSTLTIAPGERYDIVIDFSALIGQRVVVNNSASIPFPGGDPVVPGVGCGVVMAFKVNKPFNKAVPRSVPITNATLLRGLLPPGARAGTKPVSPLLAPLSVKRGTPVRRVLLGEGTDEYLRIMPLLGSVDQGTLSFHDDPTEQVVIPHGQSSISEVWEFWNASEDAHPVHMHLVRFRVINRQDFSCTVSPKDMVNGWVGVTITDPAQPQPALGTAITGPDPHETAWKDTVVCPPGFVTRVLVTFNRPGKYVYHCHILSHEEHDMMRWYTVTQL